MTLSPILISILCGLLGYLIGSIPFGWIIVKLVKGVDIRTVGSGRTGGTNAFRAAGFVPGMLTATLDVIKGAVTVLVVRNLLGGSTMGWAEALAGLGVVLGHNHSLFLGFKGGAGGATAVGTGLAFWLMGGLPALVIGVFIWFVLGYAFLATIAAALTVAIVFTIGAFSGQVPWAYVIFGWGIVLLCTLTLRPNIRRFLAGEEKRVDILKRRSSSSPQT
jgi:glycerol-3-phosphate acyltransferase PlsY